MSIYNESAAASQKAVYVIADRTVYDFPSLFERVESALNGGVSLLQYRNKSADTGEMCEESAKLLELCRKYKVPLIINDRLEVAMNAGADGVHVGIEDTPLDKVRAVLGREKIAGATAKTVSQAMEAQRQGASYLGVGALFKSPTKPGAVGITLDTLKDIRKSVSLPIYGIGGITLGNLSSEILENIDGIAVVSAVLGAQSPEKAVKEFIKRMNA